MLARHARLRRTREFQAVYEAGRSFGDPLVVLQVLPIQDRPGPSQVGFSISKKVGNAVVRNRIKRRLRAIVAPLLLGVPEGYWLVIRPRSAAAKATYLELEAALQRMWRRAGLGEKPAAT